MKQSINYYQPIDTQLIQHTINNKTKPLWLNKKYLYAILLCILVVVILTTRHYYSTNKYCLPYKLSQYQHNYNNNDLTTITYDYNATKPLACIYILTHRQRIDQLKNILYQLHIYFNAKCQYDIIIFQTDYTDNDIQYINDYVANLQFTYKTNYKFIIQSIQFKLPDHITTNELINHTTNCIGSPASYDWSIDYRHMCYFHAINVYKQTILQQYNYYMRLDDDSELLEYIQYDIFKFIQQHNIQYSYVLLDYEHNTCDIGLKDTIQQYKNLYLNDNVNQTNNIHWPEHAIVYNNIEIGSLHFWRNQQTQHMLDYIDKIKGIYLNRWGDAIIHTAVVTTLLDANEIYHFTDIQYKHKTVSSQDCIIQQQIWFKKWFNQLFQFVVC